MSSSCRKEGNNLSRCCSDRVGRICCSVAFSVSKTQNIYLLFIEENTKGNKYMMKCVTLNVLEKNGNICIILFHPLYNLNNDYVYDDDDYDDYVC